jgi:nicotinamide-nucleotide amidase
MNNNIKQIISKLREKKIILSIAESCTGGMLSQSITSISGSSEVFSFGVVTYSNQSKIKILNVPKKIINKFGSVSRECCHAMLTGLAKKSNTKLNLTITGIAGPSGGTIKKPIGLVYIGIKKNKKIIINEYLFKNKKREEIRRKSVQEALKLIKKII